MKIVNLLDKDYICANNLCEHISLFNIKPRKLPEYFNIPENNYIFALQDDSGIWKIYDKTYKRSKLYIEKIWVDNNINNIFTDNIPKIPEKSMIFLNDSLGNLIDIDIRENKVAENIYFNAEDIGIYFEDNNIRNTILKKYEKYEEYIFFHKSRKIYLYLTLIGFIKYVYTKRDIKRKHMQKELSKIMYNGLYNDIDIKQNSSDSENDFFDILKSSREFSYVKNNKYMQ